MFAISWTFFLTLFFFHLGVKDYGSVCIIGFNSPQWFLGNMGAIACGAKAAGIYPTNGPEAAAYIANHSEAQVNFQPIFYDLLLLIIKSMDMGVSFLMDVHYSNYIIITMCCIHLNFK